MRGSSRLSRADEDRLIQAYKAWDPAESSVDELAAELGTSKTTLYNVLRRRGVLRKVQAARTDDARTLDLELLDRMAEQALDVLLEQNYRLKQRVAELEEELEDLRG